MQTIDFMSTVWATTLTSSVATVGALVSTGYLFRLGLARGRPLVIGVRGHKSSAACNKSCARAPRGNRGGARVTSRDVGGLNGVQTLSMDGTPMLGWGHWPWFCMGEGSGRTAVTL